MALILLITDTERVKRVFESLDKSGILKLRTAATLIQGEQEIAASAPEFTFVQSRISGFSSEILLRHLTKILPKGANLILLTGDADEMAQAHQRAVPFLDLTLDDEELAGAVTDAFDGIYRPFPAVVAEVPVPVPTQEPHLPKVEDGGISQRPLSKVEDGATSTVQGPIPEEPEKSDISEKLDIAEKSAIPVASAIPKESDIPEESDIPKESEQLKKSEAVESPVSPPRQEIGKAGAESFAEIMRRAESVAEVPSASAPEDGPGRGRPLSEPTGSSTVRDRWGEEDSAASVSAHDLAHAVPLAEAMRRAEKKKRPRWVSVLALALLLIPMLSYLAGKRSAPPEPVPTPRSNTRPVQRPKPIPPPTPSLAPAMVPAPTTASSTAPSATPAPTRAPAPASTPASGPATVPAPATGAKPAVKPAAKAAPEPTAKPVSKQGVKSLPAVVANARLDAAYGKTHPGWQRYFGAGVEYKLFREEELFRAIQVLALKGGDIPDQLFKRVLLEFGESDSYLVESSGVKGNYLVEQGVTTRGVALTLYRDKHSRRTKAFVLYYR